MGKIQILTKEQKIILAEVGRHPFFQQFYFTGGTALSALYLLKIENFNFLPKMIEPLSLKELKEFFRQQALIVGKKSVE